MAAGRAQGVREEVSSCKVETNLPVRAKEFRVGTLKEQRWASFTYRVWRANSSNMHLVSIDENSPL